MENDKEKNKNVTILVAEDNEGHAMLIRENLRDAGVYNKILNFASGEEVYDFLMKNAHSDSQTDFEGFLALVDIGLPGMNGKELLRKIKENPDLKSIPVVMLTNTDDPVEIQACYDLGCSAYITKPIEFTDFANTLKTLGYL